MELKRYNETETGDTIIELRITKRDEKKVILNGFDRALLRECSKTSASIADSLLGLETLCRRIEEKTKLDMPEKA